MSPSVTNVLRLFAVEAEGDLTPPAPALTSVQAHRQRRRENLRLLEFPQPFSDSLAAPEWQQLVLRHRDGGRRMAYSLLRKWKSRLELDELHSLVDLALCEAARRFDAKVGASFTTFLFYHLRGVLVKAIVARSNTALLLLEDYERPLARSYTASSEAFAGREGWLSPSQWAEEQVEVDEMVFRKQLVDKFVHACRRLRGAEREVMDRLFMQQQEVQQVVEELGYSRSHVFRLRSRALGKVRHAVARPAKGSLNS